MPTNPKSSRNNLFKKYQSAIFFIFIFFTNLLAEQTAKPQFDLPSGKYRQPIRVIIQSATPNARIFYSLNGSEPDSNSIRYTAPIKIVTHATGDSITLESDNDPEPGDENKPITCFSARIKAIAFANGMEPSPVAQSNYVLDLVDGHFNIPYSGLPPAGGTKHWLDVYQPHGYENTPVLLFIHGGAWKQGDKNIYMELGNTFAGDYHLTTVIANYQLSSDPWNAVHPTHVADVALAFNWVYQNIQQYGGDPNQIYLFGQSAGGHLVSLLATDSTYLKAHGYGLENIKKVISMSGAYQLVDLVKWPQNPLGLSATDALSYKTLCLNTFGSWEETILNQASPQSHISKMQPPFLIIGLNESGTFQDMPGFRKEADNFYEKILQSNLPVEYKLLSESDIPTGILALDFPGEVEGHYEEIYAINTQYWDCPSSKMVAGSLPDVPETPIIARPSMMNNNILLAVLLQWFATVDADQYMVEIASDSAFLNQIIFPNNTVKDTIVEPYINFEAPKLYYWRVCAQNESGFSAWSQWGKFMTVKYDSGDPNLVNTIEYVTDHQINLFLFPNPFNSTLRINLENSNLQNNAGKLEIFDITGRIVKSEQLKLNSGINQLYWEPTPKTQSGVYLLRYQDGKTQLVKRVTYMK
ncbi:carboxylesterase family protein [candidate division KSB1 bacterium]|nr:carboxylesterase family protein [candidate division KSB1 bacterium]